jgi:hypothetical protein
VSVYEYSPPQMSSLEKALKKIIIFKVRLC